MSTGNNQLTVVSCDYKTCNKHIIYYLFKLMIISTIKFMLMYNCKFIKIYLIEKQQ